MVNNVEFTNKEKFDGVMNIAKSALGSGYNDHYGFIVYLIDKYGNDTIDAIYEKYYIYIQYEKNKNMLKQILSDYDCFVANNYILTNRRP